MELHRLRELIKKYNSGQASQEEKAWLENWYDGIDGHGPEHWDSGDRERLEQQLHGSLSQRTGRGAGGLFRMLLSPPAAAAALILVLTAGWLFYSRLDTSPSAISTARFKNDIAPGGDAAVLTLSDGTVISLDSMHQGAAIQQSGAKILKQDSGRLVYEPAPTGGKEITYNTLSTPRGGRFQLLLPDGTRVWLNAASSIRYPTAFAGKDRKVKITGEVYFEVAKNEELPFIVKVGETEVRVLGTHFNIMAYLDEPVVRTTLIEGAVNVRKGAEVAVIRPGEQAFSRRGAAGAIDIRKKVDTDKVLAWKSNLFHFDSTPLDEVMRQIARWYDARIAYEGPPPAISFTGLIPRNMNVSSVLKVLELTGGVQFEIEERVITVKGAAPGNNGT